MKSFLLVGLTVLAGSSRAREIVVAPDALTPAQALVVARAAKASAPRESVVVKVRTGLYTLTEPLVMTAADSGIIWKADGKAVLSGGERLTGWTDEGEGVVSCPAPTDAQGRVIYFEQLWVNGRRAAHSVWPKQGWRHPTQCTETTDQNGGRYAISRDTLVFDDAATRSLLARIPSEDFPYAKLRVGVKWSFAARNLAAIDPTTGTVEVDSAVGWLSTPWKKWNEKARVTFENVRPGFTDPGDWFYDVAGARIRYRLRPGEAAGTLQALAPTTGLTTLLRLEGVRNLRLENLGFALTAITPAHEDGLLRAKTPRGVTRTYANQAANRMDAVIQASDISRCAFVGLRIAHTGNTAIRLGDGCVSNVIARCRLTDLGAGGVWIGSGGAPTTRFNRVQDCLIADGGKTNPEGVGVVLGHASDCTVTRCEIRDFDYTGVSVGWSWGYGKSKAWNNTISFNDIHDLGKGRMDDFAGIYTLGLSRGTVISNNVIHATACVEYGGWGLYNDEGSEGIVMENNLVYDTDDGGYHLHFGRDNVVRNNIFAGNRRKSTIRVTSPEKNGVTSTLHLERNVILATPGERPFLDERAEKTEGRREANLFWDKPAAALFVDPAYGDYRIKDKAAAKRIGFKEFLHDS